MNALSAVNNSDGFVQFKVKATAPARYAVKPRQVRASSPPCRLRCVFCSPFRIACVVCFVCCLQGFSHEASCLQLFPMKQAFIQRGGQRVLKRDMR